MLRGPGRASDTRDPSAGAAELARVTRPDGAVLATVFSTTSHDPARDQIDAFAQDADWQIPAWYTQLKTTTVPILGSATAMATTIGRRSFRSVRPLTDGPLAGDNVA